MSFTSALYYPYVDITNPYWLKNAALYWERISTIVPRSIDQPYRLRTAKFLQEAGILTPLRIDPFSEAVQETSLQTQQYLQRVEGLSILFPPSFSRRERHSWQEREAVERVFMYPEKLGHELADRLLFRGDARRNGEFLEIDRNIAAYYMTVLAGNLANHEGLALLTTQKRYDTLANLARRGDTSEFRHHNSALAQSLLSKMVIQSIKVSPNTPIEKVIRFRDQHRDELGIFRQEMGNLTREMNREWDSLESLQQSLLDIYLNQVSPSINNLKASLKGFGIENHGSYLKSILLGTGISWLPASYLEPSLGSLSTPIAILAGAGISIIANVVSHRIEKTRMLRENPYSYILSIEKEFRRIR